MKRETLCWHCHRNISLCPWLTKGKPVSNWAAKDTIVNGFGADGSPTKLQSYCVITCPLYKGGGRSDR